MQRFGLALPALVALAVSVPSTGSAHPKGRLVLADRILSAGTTVGVSGLRLPPRSTVRLALAGAAGRVELAAVQTDSAGAFADSVAVPSGTSAGAYRLVALAADGDEVASLAVEVREAASAAAGHGAESSIGRHQAAEPSREDLSLARARSPWVTALAAGLAAVALALAVTMLRRPAHST
jgi:hypothetical protein